jgi:hypothetical protein
MSVHVFLCACVCVCMCVCVFMCECVCLDRPIHSGARPEAALSPDLGCKGSPGGFSLLREMVSAWGSEPLSSAPTSVPTGGSGVASIPSLPSS